TRGNFVAQSHIPPTPLLASLASAASCTEEMTDRCQLVSLIGRFGFRQRLGAGPGVFGDVEKHAFGAVQLDLEPAGAVAGLVHVMLAAQRLDLLREFLDVVDEDAEMVQAGIVETFADLVGLEP